jgi:hypothetical protein
MAELPTMDMAVVGAIKRLLENIKNDIDMHDSVDQITDLVDDHKLVGKSSYKPLLRSLCDLLREKGYPQTADFLIKQWKL